MWWQGVIAVPYYTEGSKSHVDGLMHLLHLLQPSSATAPGWRDGRDLCELWTWWHRLKQRLRSLCLGSRVSVGNSQITPHKNQRGFTTSTVISHYDIPLQYNGILMPALQQHPHEHKSKSHPLCQDWIWCALSLSLSPQRQPICYCQSIRNIEDFYISIFPRFFLIKIVHFLQAPSSDCSESTLRMMWADRYCQCNCKHEDHSSLPSSAILPLVHSKGITRNLFLLRRCRNNYIHRPWWCFC